VQTVKFLPFISCKWLC